MQLLCWTNFCSTRTFANNSCDLVSEHQILIKLLLVPNLAYSHSSILIIILQFLLFSVSSYSSSNFLAMVASFTNQILIWSQNMWLLSNVTINNCEFKDPSHPTPCQGWLPLCNLNTVNVSKKVSNNGKFYTVKG